MTNGIKRTLRIALALSPSGGWNSAGWGFDGGESEVDSELIAHAIETTAAGSVLHFVEVEVEFPTTDAIPGVVKTPLLDELAALKRLIVKMTHHPGAVEDYRTLWEPIVVEELTKDYS